MELALKYDIGLGSGGLPLDVYRRPIAPVMDVTVLEADDELSDSCSVEIVSVCEEAVIDLTCSADEEEVSCQRKRRRKRVSKTQKRQRLEDAGSTDDEPEFWIDLMDMDDNENFNSVCMAMGIPEGFL